MKKPKQVTVDEAVAAKGGKPGSLTPPAEFRMLPVKHLQASPLNPRKHFDEAKLVELAASVKEKGVLLPLLVRDAQVPGRWEIIAGERRYRAAVAAGVSEVPARIITASDVELVELALLENVARADVTALEEGEAYAKLRELGRSVEEIMARTGKSRTVVFRRMKLATLDGEARKLLASGELSPAVAELLARLPTESREDGLKALQRQMSHGETLSDVSYRTATRCLEGAIHRALAQAPFDAKDAALVDGAPACGRCPKRTGAEADLFGEVAKKDDACLDGACWQKKAAATTEKAKLEAQGKGWRVAVVALEHEADDYYQTKWADPSTTPAGSTKTWQQLLGADVPMVRVVVTRTGHTFDKVDVPAALKALAQKSPQTARAVEKSTPESHDVRYRRRVEKEKKEREADEAVTRHVRLQLARKGAKLTVEGVARAALHDKGKKLAPAMLAHELARHLIERDVNGYGVLQSEDMAAWAELAGVDAKKLRASARKAQRGICFVCGTPAPKWLNKAQTLCGDCGVAE